MLLLVVRKIKDTLSDILLLLSLSLSHPLIQHGGSKLINGLVRTIGSNMGLVPLDVKVQLADSAKLPVGESTVDVGERETMVGVACSGEESKYLALGGRGASEEDCDGRRRVGLQGLQGRRPSAFGSVGC